MKKHYNQGENNQNYKHGMVWTPTYNSWYAMKQRCNYKKHQYYSSYGGRGISVCESWVNSFENFLKDMGIKPDNTSLDRIDNNGNYTPDNCRWATHEEQRANQSRQTPIRDSKGRYISWTRL